MEEISETIELSYNPRMVELLRRSQNGRSFLARCWYKEYDVAGTLEVASGVGEFVCMEPGISGVMTIRLRDSDL